MKKITQILMFACCLTFSCQYNAEQNGEALKEKLKRTMTDFLYKGVKNDSSVVKYRVLDVTYYVAEGEYDCEFKVNMMERKLDTIGIMKAKISKDWTKVKRTF